MLHNVIKKLFILSCFSSCLLIGCSKPDIDIVNSNLEVNSEDDYEISDVIYTDSEQITGKNLERNGSLIASQGVIGFNCSYSYTSDLEGDAFAYHYNVVIEDNVMTIYHVNYDTTGDNGYTVKYEVDVDDNYVEMIRNYVDESNWSELYDEMSYFVEGNIVEGEVVSKGMNDATSRKEDGSYLWEDEFYSKLY